VFLLSFSHLTSIFIRLEKDSGQRLFFCIFVKSTKTKNKIEVIICDLSGPANRNQKVFFTWGTQGQESPENECGVCIFSFFKGRHLRDPCVRSVRL